MVGTPIPRNYGTEGSNSELSRRQNLRRFHTRWCMDRGKVEIGGPRDHVGPLELPEHQVPVRYNPDRNITPDEPRARFIVGEDRSITRPLQFQPTLSRQKEKTQGEQQQQQKRSARPSDVVFGCSNKITFDRLCVCACVTSLMDMLSCRVFAE